MKKRISLEPEAQYPVAIEQCYAVLNRLSYVLKEIGVQMNHHTLTVAGDSVGGNMAIAMEFMTKERKGPRIQKLPLQGSFGMQVPP